MNIDNYTPLCEYSGKSEKIDHFNHILRYLESEIMANHLHELIDNPNLIEKLIHSGHKKIDMNGSNLHF